MSKMMSKALRQLPSGAPSAAPIEIRNPDTSGPLLLGGSLLSTASRVADEAAQAAAPSDPIQKRAAEQFKTRDQSVQQRAAAAGAVRSENDADLLGSAKKRRDVRRVLGGD